MENTEAEVMEEIDEPSYDPYDSDDEWDNIKWSDDENNDESKEESDGAEEEADQPESEEAEQPAEQEEESVNEAEDADQWLELKYMDETKKVSKEEAKALAQKGMDYDRIREERDSLKGDLPRYKEMEAFLKEMQGDFDSIEEFMADTRARIKADAEGISYNEALEAVKAQHTTETKTSSEDDINIDGFMAKYPNVRAEEIPPEVWAEVRETKDLVAAYEKYDSGRKADRIAELEKEIKTLKNNKKNADRSTGSSKSSGASSGKSLIASLWDDDD